MSKHKVDTPSVTIKWRGAEPPYVEISSGGQLLIAGWVCQSPDEMKPIALGDNPVRDGSAFYEV